MGQETRWPKKGGGGRAGRETKWGEEPSSLKGENWRNQEREKRGGKGKREMFLHQKDKRGRLPRQIRKKKQITFGTKGPRRYAIENGRRAVRVGENRTSRVRPTSLRQTGVDTLDRDPKWGGANSPSQLPGGGRTHLMGERRKKRERSAIEKGIRGRQVKEHFFSRRKELG